MYEKLTDLLGPLEEAPSAVEAELWRRVPPSPVQLSGEVHLVTTADEAERMASEIGRMRVVAIGFDSEYRFGMADEGELDNGWQDPTRIAPVAVGLAVLVRADDGRVVAVRYAVDVRKRDTLHDLAQVLRFPALFVSHFFKAEFTVVQALSLPWPRNTVCTWLAARLLSLGRFHSRYEDPSPVDDSAEMAADGKASKKRIHCASLLALVQKYAVRYPFSGNKNAMRHRLMNFAEDENLTMEDARYVTADAYAAANLWPHIRDELALCSLEHHYHQVELPAALTFAEIELKGITVNKDKIKLAAKAAAKAVTEYERRLSKYGFRTVPATRKQIEDGAAPERVQVLSHNQRLRVMRSLGLEGLFLNSRTKSGYSFRKDKLKDNRTAHPVVELLYLHGKYLGILRDPLFAEQYISADGRIRPWIDPLGADSGRPSFKRPNIVGLGKNLRPVVVPDAPGYGLAELDFEAEEVFIAAAHFGDENLLADCNAGDPYCAMMRRFCKDEIEPQDLNLPDKPLKAKYPSLRVRMKIVVLAVTYGMMDRSVALTIKKSQTEARALRAQFFGRYHQLARGIKLAGQQLQERGYSETATGLKRFRGTSGPLSHWERRWAVNSTIQGGGADILKVLMPRLAAFLRQNDSRIVLPIFDAVLVSFPLNKKDVVLDGTEAIMVDTMREIYPGTQPRVDRNDLDPTCWNKAGHGDSIERFLKDPEYKPQ